MRQMAWLAPSFSERERGVLLAVAKAALPAGARLPAAGADTVARVEAFFLEQPAGLRAAYRGLLRLLDGAALLSHRKGFAALAEAEGLALLESWRGAGLARRNALRMLLLPVKALHFDHASTYRALGCVYERPAPAAEARPAHLRDRVHAASGAGGALELECEVVVVGTGAGGAVVAKELAEAGCAVILLEEGAYADRRDFAGRPLENQRKLYRASGATFSIGNVLIPIPLGRTVGGTTAINSGTCFRTPEQVLLRWGQEFGLRELSPERLAPHFERVEQILGVAPVPPEHLGGCARVVIRGANALGLRRHRPLARNAPGCDGQGVCCFGCPTDAKRSTNVSYVPLALRAGAELYTGVTAERLLFEGARVVGVRGTSSSGHAVTVRARAVVLACGSLLTPILMMRNGVGGGSGQLGKNLSIHPAAACLAEMAEPIESWSGVPQGYLIDEFADDGLLLEGVATPLEYWASAMSAMGPRMVELAEAYQRIASFGMMVSDTSRGRVRLVRDRAVITYNLNDADVGKLVRGVIELSRIFFAAGARSVISPVHGFEDLRSLADLEALRRARVRASDLALSAHHPLGTARMGADPATAVVDADHQVYGSPGLYVIDGSAVPTALGVNPQVTIMALATRAAQRLAARLG